MSAEKIVDSMLKDRGKEYAEMLLKLASVAAIAVYERTDWGKELLKY